MSDNDIRALATNAFARFNEDEGRAAFFDAYDADVALHGYPGALQGLDGLRAFHEALWEAFPDARLTVEDLVVEGDRAALRYRLQGTHRGPYLGVPPPDWGSTSRGSRCCAWPTGAWWRNGTARPNWRSCASSEPSTPTSRTRGASAGSLRAARRRPRPLRCGSRSARPNRPSRRTVDAQRRCRRER